MADDFIKRRTEFLSEDAKPTLFQKARMKIKEGELSLRDKITQRQNRKQEEKRIFKEEKEKFDKQAYRNKVKQQIQEQEKRKFSNVIKRATEVTPKQADQFQSRAENIFLNNPRLPDLSELNATMEIQNTNSPLYQDFTIDRNAIADKLYGKQRRF